MGAILFCKTKMRKGPGTSLWKRRFIRDSRGSVAIEFGLTAVIFFGILAAIFELALVYFSIQGLQVAVTAAARQMMTGKAQANSQAVSSTAQFNTTYVCPHLPKYMDCTKLITDIQTATSFATADTSKTFYTGPTKYCPGTPGAIVVIRVVYPLPAIFLMSFGNRYLGLSNNVPGASGWMHVLLGTAVIQNEPFTTNFATGGSC